MSHGVTVEIKVWMEMLEETGHWEGTSVNLNISVLMHLLSDHVYFKDLSKCKGPSMKDMMFEVL